MKIDLSTRRPQDPAPFQMEQIRGRGTCSVPPYFLSVNLFLSSATIIFIDPCPPPLKRQGQTQDTAALHVIGPVGQSFPPYFGLPWIYSGIPSYKEMRKRLKSLKRKRFWKDLMKNLALRIFAGFFYVFCRN